jgi:hypothetical protein
MIFCFFCHNGYHEAPQRQGQVEHGQGARTHQSIEAGTLPSIWRRGHLDLQWLPLQRGQGPSWGQGCLPFGASSAEVSLLSTMVASSGRRPRAGGGSNEVMVSLIFLSVSNVPVIVYRQG